MYVLLCSILKIIIIWSPGHLVQPHPHARECKHGRHSTVMPWTIILCLPSVMHLWFNSGWIGLRASIQLHLYGGGHVFCLGSSWAPESRGRWCNWKIRKWTPSHFWPFRQKIRSSLFFCSFPLLRKHFKGHTLTTDHFWHPELLLTLRITSDTADHFRHCGSLSTLRITSDTADHFRHCGSLSTLRITPSLSLKLAFPACHSDYTPFAA